MFVCQNFQRFSVQPAEPAGHATRYRHMRTQILSPRHSETGPAGARRAMSWRSMRRRILLPSEPPPTSQARSWPKAHRQGQPRRAQAKSRQAEAQTLSAAPDQRQQAAEPDRTRCCWPRPINGPPAGPPQAGASRHPAHWVARATVAPRAASSNGPCRKREGRTPRQICRGEALRLSGARGEKFATDGVCWVVFLFGGSTTPRYART